MEGASAPDRAGARTLRNLIGREWVPSSADQVLEDRNPADGSLLALIPLSNARDVDLAVTAARSAQAVWRETGVLERARIVRRVGDALTAHRKELAQLVTKDMGKTVAEADAEVGRGIESVEAATAVATAMKGENLEGVASGVDVEMLRQPVGVVAAITPFNFPSMIPLWFLPFAIATGNGFVLKPSERDPLPAERIAELVSGVEGLPAGLVNLVHGGREAVNALLDHPGVDAISFVGQASTARYVASRAAENGKRFQALGGAKNALILMPDANMQASVPAITSSAFGAAGQRCLAGSVLVLVGTRAEQDAACKSVIDAARALKLGPGSDPATDVCPMVSPEARERAERFIEEAVSQGMDLLLDGRTEGRSDTQLAPTIIETSDADSPVVRDEVFGPVLSVVRVEDLDQALEFLNRSRYGNASMIFTTSGKAARHFKSRIDAGMIGINIGVPAPVAGFPFAGWKDSFDGDLHANGTDAFEFYTRKKVVTSRWP